MEEVEQVRGKGTPEKYERTLIGFDANCKKGYTLSTIASCIRFRSSKFVRKSIARIGEVLCATHPFTPIHD